MKERKKTTGHLQRYKQQMSDSLLALFHLCLVSVLFSAPSILKWNEVLQKLFSLVLIQTITCELHCCREQLLCHCFPTLLPYSFPTCTMLQSCQTSSSLDTLKTSDYLTSLFISPMPWRRQVTVMATAWLAHLWWKQQLTLTAFSSWSDSLLLILDSWMIFSLNYKLHNFFLYILYIVLLCLY